MNLSRHMAAEDDEDWEVVDPPRTTLLWSQYGDSWPLDKTIQWLEYMMATMTPWRTVHTLNHTFHQIVMDALQVALDRSPTLDGGFAREAAIKTQQAISRISDCLPNGLELDKDKVYREPDIIASGGFADIYKGVYESHDVCIKKLRLRPEKSRAKVAKEFRHEVLLWRQLSHPRILEFRGILMKEDTGFCLISSWLKHGNVITFLESWPDFDRLKILLEAIEGIEYLHAHHPPIVHADIRGANILVRDDYTCCLADFGLTVAIETREPTASWLGKGTSYWMSPEVWTSTNACIPARDIYAFGCTVIEIYSGTHPFPLIKSKENLMYEVVKKKRKPSRPESLLQDGLWTIVELCLAYSPKRRPTACDVGGKLRTFARSVNHAAPL